MKGIAVKIHAIAVGFSVVLPALVCTAEDDTRYYIHSIGDGTLVVNSCLLPERFAVRTEHDTVVIRLDGEKGALSDLKVGQWVKLTPRSDQDGSENLRISRIEVVAPPEKPVDTGGLLTFDVYSGYFVSNKFETNAAESFVVITDQAKFDHVFGVAFVMNDKSHRLPKDAFESLIVVAVIKRGNAFWEYGVEDVTEDQGVIQLRYKASSRATPDTTFACPLIVSVPRDKYRAANFWENGKNVKTVKLLPQARE